uniref:Uncharacterized protein n=1 Tax=Rhizophora mucronata TaxID=61149 RepID=A0A2P2R077_RHIMU
MFMIGAEKKQILMKELTTLYRTLM